MNQAEVDAQQGRVYAERFLDAWKSLSSHLSALREASFKSSPGSEPLDDSATLRWAYRTGVLSSETFTFIDTCRRARNAYAHVIFEGYGGPVAVPPLEVVHRLERLASSLRNPPKVTAVSVPAVTCSANSSILEALRIMRHENFSQLPYFTPDRGWLLITRDHVSRWVEASTEADAVCLLDLSCEVASLPELAGVASVVPKQTSRSTLLADAVRELADAFAAPDTALGGYPLLLVVEDGSQSPEVLAAEDLPRAYEVLGR